MNSKIDPDILQSASTWLHPPYDIETIQQVQWLIDNDPKELTESFYRHLEFGTGGLRGIMGVGTNRMNKYTVAMATQGLANYIRKMFPHIAQPSVAIAHDCRNNSDGFAQITAEVMTANGIAVYMFDSLRPTPVLSFAVRHFGCQSGIVITASHNPKEYNGYKAYWNDGGQLIAPHDKNVIAEVKRIKGPADVRFDTKPELITVLDEEFDKIYVTKVKELSLSPEAISRQKDFKLVFTPIHGSTVRIAPMALKAVGFSQIYGVEAQNIVDGNFPTVHSPNPEEPAALSMAIKKAKEVNADLVMATDPDGDRVGIAVKDGKGDYLLLNGNQAASLLIYYLLHKWKENNLLTGNEFIAKTIVTSELLVDIAAKYGVESYDVLTGFKYIADLIKRYEGKKTFIGGGEESYGYLVGDFVRDKDAVISCVMLAETAAWAKDIGKSMLELLQDLYIEFGFYKEHLLSVTKKGMEGVAEIKALMERYRNHPPQELDSSKVVIIKDYLLSVTKDLQTGSENTIDLPKSDVLQFILEDGSKISIRPSGTEPKIKFYFGVKGTLSSREQYEAEDKNLGRKIDRIISALNI
ncbi:MAG: phospho-sugar mutase [Bacteroidales bacterium]|jgi:phosphoglucomutase|nr:phospho-sugar mutase [Bacteroidales bacterium]MDD3701529.1 phospho-sugar mutase [Bacteroidales bacterium]MDY0369257.1 phospho-sugar mutase [Bacteroidales bacterium]